MTDTEIKVLHEEYVTTLRAYTTAAEKTGLALGEVKPIGSGPVPRISPEWVRAMEEEREVQKRYEAARDAYWAAVQGERR